MTPAKKLAATLLLLAYAIAAVADQRILLGPKLRPGQVLTFLVRLQIHKRVKTESKVVVPFGPDAAQIDAHGLLRIEILEVRQEAGKPVVRGTRLAVEFILDLLAAGQSEADLLGNYPGLTHDDILACLAYARDTLSSEKVFPSAA